MHVARRECWHAECETYCVTADFSHILALYGLGSVAVCQEKVVMVLLRRVSLIVGAMLMIVLSSGINRPGAFARIVVSERNWRRSLWKVTM